MGEPFHAFEVHGIIFDDQCNGEPVNVAGFDLDDSDQLMVAGPATKRDEGWIISDAFGRVTEVRAILGAADCRSDADRGLLDLNNGRSFLRATAHLFTGMYPSLEDLLVLGQLRWAAEGSILEKLDGTIVRAVLSTVRLHSPMTLPPGKFRVFPGPG